MSEIRYLCGHKREGERKRQKKVIFFKPSEARSFISFRLPINLSTVKISSSQSQRSTLSAHRFFIFLSSTVARCCCAAAMGSLSREAQCDCLFFNIVYGVRHKFNVRTLRFDFIYWKIYVCYRSCSRLKRCSLIASSICLLRFFLSLLPLRFTALLGRV